MKLRIHDNAIRFRLSQGEVARLTTAGRVEGHAQFGPAGEDDLVYAVEVSAACREVEAHRSRNEIRVTLPRDVVKTWAATDQVSIERAQAIGPDSKLEILVEKDFRCLHTRAGEARDDRDAFPNPQESASPRD